MKTLVKKIEGKVSILIYFSFRKEKYILHFFNNFQNKR